MSVALLKIIYSCATLLLINNDCCLIEKTC